MSRIAISSLALAAIVTGLGMVKPNSGRAENLTNTQNIPKHQELVATAITEGRALPTSNTLMAQMFYPSVSDDRGLMVQGQGEASAPADTARIEFTFSSSTNPFDAQSEGSTSSSPEPITQTILQPVVDALVAIGVPANAIEVNTSPSSSQPFPFPFPLPNSGGSAQVLVKLDKPTREQVQQIVTVGSKDEKLKGNLSMQGVSVKYEVNDCQALAKAAYLAAVNDARNRAAALSEALGVKMADIPSIAESPFLGFFGLGSSSSCDAKPNTPIFPFGAIKQPYNPAAPAEVQLKKEIFVTYRIR